MANNYEQYSFMVPCANDEQKDWLIVALNAVTEGKEYIDIGEYSKEADGVWCYAEDSGDPHALSEIIHGFLSNFDLDHHIIISVAYTCSKMRLDEFGGWAIGISKDKIVDSSPISIVTEALNA